MTSMAAWELDAEEWLDEWTDELREEIYELREDMEGRAFQALSDDECDECHLDIYEGEPVINTAPGALVHASCYEREGNVW